jgi:hypothetical protein
MAVQAEHDFWGTLSVVLLAIVGVASLAVLVSKNANTQGVIASTGSAFSNALGVAISPVTGGGSSLTSFPIG